MAPIAALPEQWTELMTAREQHAHLVADVTAIKTECGANHEARHVSECSTCFPKVLDRLYARYKDSTGGREWFSERSMVIPGLDTVISEAKAGKAKLSDIDVNIASEKEAWYRWVLRRHPEFLAVARTGKEKQVRDLLNDPDTTRDELVRAVGEAVGMPEHWSEEIDGFVEKYQARRGDEKALKELYIQQFFKDQATGETLPHARKYLDMYEGDLSVKLEDVIGKIIAANKDDRSTQTKREEHKKRLDELRRAKTTFERDRAKAKSQAQGAQKSSVEEKLDNLPPCRTCRQQVDPDVYWPCALCMTMVQLGGAGDLTVYCSQECDDKGRLDHETEAHLCHAGESCVFFTDPETSEQAGGPESAKMCNECLDKKEATVYCTLTCAGRHLPRHRRSVHGAEMEVDRIQGLVSPLHKVVEMTLTGEKVGADITFR